MLAHLSSLHDPVAGQRFTDSTWISKSLENVSDFGLHIASTSSITTENFPIICSRSFFNNRHDSDPVMPESKDVSANVQTCVPFLFVMHTLCAAVNMAVSMQAWLP
jgi:hypothetical protein